MKIAFYISGHGFGHATRSAEIVRAMNHRVKGTGQTIAWSIRTMAPAWLFGGAGIERGEVVQVASDAGVVEEGAFDIDVSATCAAISQFREKLPGWIKREAIFLQEGGFDLVLSDISPWPAEAASRANIKPVAVSNFGWDFIYRHLEIENLKSDERLALENEISEIEQAYTKYDLLLRYPMCEPMKAFSQVRDVSMVARHAPKGASQIRRELLAENGISATDQRAFVLLLLRHDTLSPEALKKIAQNEDYLFASSQPWRLKSQNLIQISHAWERRFLEIIAAADLVISKPGYGTVSDCLANQTRLLLLPRRGFAEGDVVREAAEQLLGSLTMNEADFLSGDWGESVAKTMALPAPAPSISLNGADTIAGILLQEFST